MTTSPTPTAPSGELLLDPEIEKAPPPREWRVVMHNDDYTPMDFVMDVLEEIFAMPLLQARDLTLQIHYRGRGICGTYSREIAEQRVAQVTRLAELEGHPLMCTLEPDTSA